MKHLLLLPAGASLVVPQVAAQPTGAQACERRCKDADLDGPGVAPYNPKLVQVLERKKLETDPARRQALDTEEARARARRDAFIGRTCRYICSGD
jgi:hypothetical protein